MSAPSSPPAAGSRVAVVGGTGFLGTYIVRELAQTGYRPVVIARHPELITTLLPGLAVEMRTADVTNLPTLTEALAGCAAVHSTVALVDQALVPASAKAERLLITTNVEGGLNVLRAARAAGLSRVILTGSCSMRYAEGGATTSEGSPPTLLALVNDAYVQSKLALERQGTALAEQLGLCLTITMPGALYGPGDRLPSLFGKSILSRLKGNAEPSLVGGMPLIDIRDVARAHIRIMERDDPAPSYLLVAETINTKAWHDLISTLAGVPRVERYISPKLAFAMASLADAAAKISGNPPRFTRNMIQHIAINQQFNCALAREQLGIAFTPTTTTLRDAIAWFRENGYVTGP